MGPFLSGFSPEQLIRGLRSVRLTGAEAHRASLRCFRAWIEQCLRGCADRVESASMEAVSLEVECMEEGSSPLGMAWEYEDERFLHWSYDFNSKEARITANFGGGKLELPQILEPIREEMALSESLFF